MSRPADEQTFQKWEKLIDEGVPFFEASRQAETTMRRLRDADRIRAEDAVELSDERQAAKVERVMGEELAKDDRSAQLVALEAKARHPAYRDKTQIEVSGREGGPIQVEGRVVAGLADVVDFLRGVGAGAPLRLDSAAGDPRPALPPAADVLPDPS